MATTQKRRANKSGKLIRVVPSEAYYDLGKLLLGACLNSYEAIERCVDMGITAAHFRESDQYQLWQVLLHHYREGATPSKTSIDTTALRLGFCPDQIPLPDPISPDDVAYHASTLIDAYQRDMIVQLMIAIKEDLLGGKQAPEILARMESFFLSDFLHSENSQPVRLSDIMPGILDALLKGNDGGLPTGFSGLDRITGGFHPGRLYILAGRPAMGKTALALNLATNSRKPTLFISLEMSQQELGYRIYAHRVGPSLNAYRSGYGGKHAADELAEVVKMDHLRNIFVQDYPIQTIASIRSLCRKVAKKSPLGLIIVDYLQLIRHGDPRLPRDQQVADISKGLKALAKELKLPILALCQINRSAEQENRTPRMSDLRESGSIEQDADVILFIDKQENCRQMDESGMDIIPRAVVVSKNRHGHTGIVPMIFKKDYQLFRDEAWQYQME